MDRTIPVNADNSDDAADTSSRREPELQEGLDYYIENGLFVFTGAFLLKRGYCCDSGCRHCPYENGPANEVDG